MFFKGPQFPDRYLPQLCGEVILDIVIIPVIIPLLCILRVVGLLPVYEEKRPIL